MAYALEVNERYGSTHLRGLHDCCCNLVVLDSRSAGGDQLEEWCLIEVLDGLMNTCLQPVQHWRSLGWPVVTGEGGQHRAVQGPAYIRQSWCGLLRRAHPLPDGVTQISRSAYLVAWCPATAWSCCGLLLTSVCGRGSDVRDLARPRAAGSGPTSGQGMPCSRLVLRCRAFIAVGRVVRPGDQACGRLEFVLVLAAACVRSTHIPRGRGK